MVVLCVMVSQMKIIPKNRLLAGCVTVACLLLSSGFDGIINQWQGTYDELVKEGVVKDIFQIHDLINLYPTFYDD